MNAFNAKVVTPEGEKYKGTPKKITLRTLTGEIGILARHTDYIAAVDTCIVRITEEDGALSAVCGGGFMTIDKGDFTLVCDTFVTADQIDKASIESRIAKVKERIELCRDNREKKILKAELKRLELMEKVIRE